MTMSRSTPTQTPPCISVSLSDPVLSTIRFYDDFCVELALVDYNWSRLFFVYFYEDHRMNRLFEMTTLLTSHCFHGKTASTE